MIKKLIEQKEILLILFSNLYKQKSHIITTPPLFVIKIYPNIISFSNWIYKRKANLTFQA